MAEKEFPEIKEKNQGKFTAWAKKNGFKDACSAASAVMKNKKKYSSNVVKMANYANNFGCSTAKSPAKQTDKKIKKMEEKTKRIGIRQGERTRRVEARNNPKKTTAKANEVSNSVKRQKRDYLFSANHGGAKNLNEWENMNSIKDKKKTNAKF